jgi:ATP-binding cassette subfamily E protein 1
MATYLADRVIVFEGKPAIESYARTPEGLLTGMNKFLRSLDITFRRDPTNLYVYFLFPFLFSLLVSSS